MSFKPWMDVRVAISPPASDETFSSVVDRAAAFWGMERSGLVASWELDATSTVVAVEADSPTPNLLAALAHTIGVSDAALRLTIVEANEVTIGGGHRLAYCPLCWSDDCEQGRDPYFRRAWCALSAIRCERHAVPLCPWLRNSQGARYTPPTRQSIRLGDSAWQHNVRYAAAWRDASGSQLMQDVLAEIATFSDQAIKSLQGGEFPAHWRGDVQTLRDLIVLLTTNPAPFTERIPLDRLVPAVADERLFGSRRGTSAPLSVREGWEAVRRLGSPQVRRTLWWLVGRTIVPQWKPMPLRGLPGVCHDPLTWWKRRIETSVSGHGLLEAQRVASRLGLRTHEPVGDLFAA